MVSDVSSQPDWRDAEDYAALARVEPAAMAWEWLRRDASYRAAAERSSGIGRIAGAISMPTERSAEHWGLHAFENPDLSALVARPVWRRERFARVLPAVAFDSGSFDDRFDLGRFAELATVITGQHGAEHVLLSDGCSSLRIDITAGSLLCGPVRLAYGLVGLASLSGPLETLRGLLHLWRSGRLHRPVSARRNRRLVLLLRGYDALRAGAAQRDIAEWLLSGDARRARWRSDVPSLRSQAQRLAKGARAMAEGGYRTLLSS